MAALISVAMATYNGERFLREQMDSILSQTYKNIEVVACDDCSTDSTWQILQEYAAKDGRVRCFKNEANLGFKKNFEKAISLCKGEFIALSDQDDIWLKEKLEVQLEAFNKQNVTGWGADIVCSASFRIDKNGNALSGRLRKIASLVTPIPNDAKKQFAILMLGNFVRGATLFAKASFLRQCLPVPDFQTFHDKWFSINAVVQNGMFYIPKPLILYRKHPEQATWSDTSNYSSDTKKDLQNKMMAIRKWVDDVQGSFNLTEEYQQIARNAIKLTEHQKHIGWFKAIYVFKNCGIRNFLMSGLANAHSFLKKTRRKLCKKKR